VFYVLGHIRGQGTAFRGNVNLRKTHGANEIAEAV
jgi:hypothetical protein